MVVPARYHRRSLSYDIVTMCGWQLISQYRLIDIIPISFHCDLEQILMTDLLTTKFMYLFLTNAVSLVEMHLSISRCHTRCQQFITLSSLSLILLNVRVTASPFVVSIFHAYSGCWDFTPRIPTCLLLLPPIKQIFLPLINIFTKIL